MKAFEIIGTKILTGLPIHVPHDPSCDIKKKRINNISFVLEAQHSENNNFQDVIEEDLTGGSELAYFEVIPETETNQKYILVMFNPIEYELGTEYGDISEIVYRDPVEMVVIARVSTKKDKGWIIPKNKVYKYFYKVKNKKLVQCEFNVVTIKEMERTAIELRREITTMFEF